MKVSFSFSPQTKILMGPMLPEKVIEQLKIRFTQIESVDYTLEQHKGETLMIIKSIKEK